MTTGKRLGFLRTLMYGLGRVSFRLELRPFLDRGFDWKPCMRVVDGAINRDCFLTHTFPYLPVACSLAFALLL